MQKRWCGSSALVRDGLAKGGAAAISLLIGAALLTAQPGDAWARSRGKPGRRVPAQAVPSPSPAPSLVPTGEAGLSGAAFLQLPSFDLEAVLPADQKEFRVGDLVQFRARGLEGAKALKFDLPPAPESAPAPTPVPSLVPSPVPTPGAEASASPAADPVLSLEEQGWALRSDAQTGLAAVALKPGELTLPSLAIREEGRAEPVGRSNPVTVRVSSAIPANDPKPEEPAPIRPPVGLEFPLWAVIFLGVGALSLIGLGIWAYLRWRAKQPKSPAAPAPAGPPKSEDQLALDALAEIHRKGLMMKGQYKAHYFGISEALKRYFGSRFRIDALESTSREMILELESRRQATPEQIGRIGKLFDQLDRVKFTDFVPTNEDGLAVLEEAKALVLETRKPPAQAPQILTRSDET